MIQLIVLIAIIWLSVHFYRKRRKKKIVATLSVTKKKFEYGVPFTFTINKDSDYKDSDIDWSKPVNLWSPHNSNRIIAYHKDRTKLGGSYNDDLSEHLYYQKKYNAIPVHVNKETITLSITLYNESKFNHPNDPDSGNATLTTEE